MILRWNQIGKSYWGGGDKKCSNLTARKELKERKFKNERRKTNLKEEISDIKTTVQIAEESKQRIVAMPEKIKGYINRIQQYKQNF